MTNTVVDTKIGEVENKIPDVSGLVRKADCDAKISDIEVKYFDTSNYNKFMSNILDEKIKKIVDKFNISNLVKKFRFKHKTCNIFNKSRIKSRPR